MNKIDMINVVSVGITHVSGKILFKNPTTKWARSYFSVCHYSQTSI